MKTAFLDRDGTLIWEPPETKQVDSLEEASDSVSRRVGAANAARGGVFPGSGQ